MAETALTVQELEGPFDIASATDLDFTFAAADNVNGNSYIVTGREILVARNDNVGAQTLTLNGVPDEKNRSGPITAYSIGIGLYSIFTQGLTNAKGFKQSDGTITLIASAADVMLAVLRLPA